MARYMTYNANRNNSFQNFETELKNFLNLTPKIEKKLGEAELVQFLGLKDKNGTLIHFGDILKDNTNTLLTPVCEIEHGEHILFFKPIKHINKKIKIGCKSTYSNTLEIVGNIYINTKIFDISKKDLKKIEITCIWQ